jgi:hypothetical protein
MLSVLPLDTSDFKGIREEGVYKMLIHGKGKL